MREQPRRKERGVGVVVFPLQQLPERGAALAVERVDLRARLDQLLRHGVGMESGGSVKCGVSILGAPPRGGWDAAY